VRRTHGSGEVPNHVRLFRGQRQSHLASVPVPKLLLRLNAANNGRMGHSNDSRGLAKKNTISGLILVNSDHSVDIATIL